MVKKHKNSNSRKFGQGESFIALSSMACFGFPGSFPPISH